MKFLQCYSQSCKSYVILKSPKSRAKFAHKHEGFHRASHLLSSYDNTGNIKILLKQSVCTVLLYRAFSD